MKRILNELMIGAGVGAVLLLVWSGSFFTQIRQRMEDIYYVTAPTSGQIVIVAIDDDSLEVYGRSPAEWSRVVFANLVDELSAAQARVIALDVLFPEATINDTTLAEAITQARTSDNRVRVVLPTVGIDVPSPIQQSLLFTVTRESVNTIQSAVDYVGFVNALPDADSVIRQQASRITLGGDTHLAYPLAVYLAYLRIPAAAVSQLVVPGEGTLQVTPERTLQVDAAGLWTQNYFGRDAFSTFSLRAVLNGEVDMSVFADKIVIVGLINSTGAVDTYPTPQGLMPGAVILANAVESIIQNKLPYAQSRVGQALTIVVLSLASSIIYPRFRWYWTPLLAFVAVATWWLFAFVLFATRLEMLNLFHPTLALVLVSAAHVLRVTRAESRRRESAEFLLASVVEISDQQLDLERILPRIAQDLQRLTHASHGALWLRDTDTGALVLRHRWGTEVPLPRLFTTDVFAAREGWVFVPVFWHVRWLGVFGLQLAHVGRATKRLLENYAQQVAPSLENAALHTAVTQQNALLAAILESSPAAIGVCDAQLNVDSANTALRDVILGEATSLLEVLDDDARAKIQRAINTRQHFHEEVSIKTYTFQVNAAPLGVEDWVVVFNDITAITELSNLKTRTLRMASHDLKNPLSRVLAYGTLVLEGKDSLSDTQRRFITRMVDGGNEMLRIIQDILDLEQLRAAKVQYAPIDFGALVHEIAQTHRGDAQRKEQAFTIEISEPLPSVGGDQRLLTQAVTNLIGNAIKYTPDRGSIYVRALAVERAVRFEVQDTGYGIPAEMQSNLFKEFYRAKTDATANIPGTGLGLSLVKSVIDAHSGKIGVASEEGKGSTFFFELPVASIK